MNPIFPFEPVRTDKFPVGDINPNFSKGVFSGVKRSLWVLASRVALQTFGQTLTDQAKGTTAGRKLQDSLPIRRPWLTVGESRRVTRPAKVSAVLVQSGVEGVCRFLLRQRPEACTLERSTLKRDGKIYLDYLQNGWGRTMAGIYSTRPTIQGQVSTPLLWEEVLTGEDPIQFTIRNSKKRIDKVGDLSQIMKEKMDFNKILHYFT